MIADAFWEIVFQHVITFVGGLVIGFVLSNRFKIIRRNGQASTDRSGL